MRARSAKRARLYAERRRFVARILDERPICERCQRRRSCDVHELKSRARGGSILDAANCIALCRECHEFLTTNPAAAEAEGLSLPSWAADPTTSPDGALS